MRHQRAGKKLGRDASHRRALYANLTCALIEHGRVRTTVTKAKAVKPIAEQMITLARRGDLHARRQAVAFLRSKDVVHKLFSEVGPGFAERPGGYARIVRIGPRQGDAAEMAYLELVDAGPVLFKTRLPREEAATEPEAEEATEAAAEPEAEAQEAEAEPEPEAGVEPAAEAEAESAEPEAEAEPPAEEPDGDAEPESKQ